MSDHELPGWTAQARHLLEDSAAHLDAAALSRLNRARQAALAQRASRRRRTWLLLPAGLAGVCALLLAVGVWQGRQRQLAPNTAQPVAAGAALNASDLDMIANGENLEMMQDLDFYAWLDAQGQDNDG